MAVMSSKQIIIPITKANMQGIDDILDAAKALFDGSLTVVEAYVVETNNPGMAALAQALAEKSGSLEAVKRGGRRKGNREGAQKEETNGG